jgi:phenylacetate-CoA ligase
MKKVLKSLLGYFRPQIDYVIYSWHGLSRRKLSDYLDIRFFRKLLNNEDAKDLFLNLTKTREEIEEIKFRRIKQIVEYAYKYIPFYRFFYEEKEFHPSMLDSIDDVSRIPILEKSAFKEAINQKTIFSTESRSWKIVCGETTGSTGVPTRVCIDERAKKIRSWGMARAWFVNGILPSDPFVLVWRDKGIDRRELLSFIFGNFLYVPVMNIMDIKSTTLDKDKILRILSILEKYQPSVIRGYVSALHVLARFYAKYRDRFKIAPKLIVGSAEYLPPSVWDEIEEIFGCKMINLYGGTEASPIAISTIHSREHIVFEDIFHIDLVNFSGNEIQKGTGRILVTDLHNEYMPLIRYEIGDIAEWSGNYQMGFRTFKEVKGRKNDIFVLPGGKIVFADAWYVFFRDKPWIKKFKIIQHDIDSIVIMVEVENVESAREDFELLKKEIIASVGKDVRIEFELTAYIPLDRGEKFRHVVSKVDISSVLNKI